MTIHGCDRALGRGAGQPHQRVVTVRNALDKAGLVGLVAFGDCWRGANITYFTEFRLLDGVSEIANPVLLLGVDSGPVLFQQIRL